MALMNKTVNYATYNSTKPPNFVNSTGIVPDKFFPDNLLHKQKNVKNIKDTDHICAKLSESEQGHIHLYVV